MGREGRRRGGDTACSRPDNNCLFWFEAENMLRLILATPSCCTVLALSEDDITDCLRAIRAPGIRSSSSSKLEIKPSLVPLKDQSYE